ncbi:MAG TPA: hypothetical protein VGU26_09385 [Gaiellaceae bacterium]|nr:hypothetical protein [Gaiellaceae bacterium]
MTELILAALLAAAVVVFVAVPFLRAHEPPRAEEPAEEMLAAAEERDRALAELRELEFDHRTGKITDDDYRALVQPLRRRAAHTLANGGSLPGRAAEEPPQQQFSAHSPPSGRPDR